MPYIMVCDKCNKEANKNYVQDRATLILDGWKAEVMLVNHHDQIQGRLVLCEGCFCQIVREGKLLHERWTA